MKYSIIVVLLVGLSCQQEKTVLEPKTQVSNADKVLHEMATTYLFPLPENAMDEAHPYRAALVNLGKELYYEKVISKDKSVSCNTCHPLESYGVNDTPLSKGVGGHLGDRNSPTTYNAALHLAQFWDGRAKDVEAQVEGPLLNPKEMAMSSKAEVVHRLQQMPKYLALFAQAYPHEKTIKYPQIAQAIGAFERTLMTPSRLDEYLEGHLDVLSEKEKQGLKKMLDFGCIPCHSGAAMGGALYQKFGLFDNYQRFTKSNKHDVGKLAITQEESDRDVFKVPSLRNITKTAPYFHDGSVKKLEDAVRIMGNVQLGRALTEQDVEDIIAFLAVSADWTKKTDGTK
ncbi:MAG TPA: c-type cytochrome [Saprospiraceae bacterium]|nr:c-type cytochrome [Saprospiraceae bacterium]